MEISNFSGDSVAERQRPTEISNEKGYSNDFETYYEVIIYRSSFGCAWL